MLEFSRMNREREIFLEALDQPTEKARADFVEQATAGDAKLRKAVEALLACNQADTIRIEEGAFEILRKSMEAEGKLAIGEECIGDVIGRYKLLEKIGEGGFGIVYRAEQTEPVKRHVALKVIKLGMDTRSIVARFEAERQALALMDHPSIARIFDGGATATGRPYFVMELVRGVRITDYCDANELPLQNRLHLFTELCHAIQHAHQKGVIHRDLKPSNVLVTLEGGKPIPKVIDFGIAKAIEEPLTEKTILTNFHSFIGTPAYTSPEQAEMTGSVVDTRSDIYSLGVLLYELLTGVTPFDAKELISSGLDGMRRMIKEVEPPTPSTRMRSSTAGSGARQLWTSIDKDLDSIVMKCLEKNPARRYATAREIPADIDRYLNHEAVLARPQNAVYRFQKTVRRHRTAFAAGIAILIAVLTGATLSVWQALRATRAERVSEARRISEEHLRINAEQQRERAVENQLRAELNEYVADVNLASQAIQSGNLTRATELLEKPRNEGLRGFEWGYLRNAAKGDEHKVFAQETSSVLSLAHSADSLVVGLRDSVHIYDAKRGSLEKRLDGSGLSVALSTNGLLATASSSTVRVWRSPDWSEAFAIRGQSAPVAFSHHGRFLAANSREGIRIHDASDGHFISLVPNSMPPFAFSPRDDVLAVDTREGIAVWSVNEVKILRVLQGSEGVFDTRWTRERRILDFSRDGRSIVAARNTLRSGSIFVLELWDAATRFVVARGQLQ